MHPEEAGHGREATGIGEVHERRVEDVVLMVPEGYLVTPQLLRHLEERLSAVPRTEETGCALLITVGLKLYEALVIGDAVARALLAKVIRVRLVIYARHSHMQGMKREALIASAQHVAHEVEQGEGVLSTRQADEDNIRGSYELKLLNPLSKSA